MFFSSARVPYEKGMLLEAVKLNDDFALEHFLLRFSATSRCSDGIIGGMVIRAHESTLTLEPGVFKLGESLGWLRDPLVLEMPLRKVWCRLWLMAEMTLGP